MAFKLPTFTRTGRKRDSGGKVRDTVVAATAETASAAGTLPATAVTHSVEAARGIKTIPLIGKLSTAAQYGVLGVLLLALLGAISVIVLIDSRIATNGTIYVSAAAEMRMLSQRVAKATQSGLAGSAPALRQLQESREQFAAALQLLTLGGQSGDTAVPPTSDAVMPVLEQGVREWEKVDQNILQVVAQTRNLVSLGTSVRTINASALADLAEEVHAYRTQSNAAARDIAVSAQAAMLSQRLSKSANAILVSDIIDSGLAAGMERDAAALAESLRQLQSPAGPARGTVPNPDAISKLDALQKASGEFQAAVTAIVGNLQALASAKQAGRRLVDDSEQLLNATRTLSQAYDGELAGRKNNFIALAVLSLLAAIVIALLVRVYLDDTRRRAAQSEQERAQSELERRATQDAILRLMDEMGSLAEGNLTVHATVSEDVTGAIADAVNFTVDELKGLVGRINSASAQVAGATEAARETSARLLAAAETQSMEILQTSESVLAMAAAMGDMSQSAAKSAEVARQSVASARKGASAVLNSISGMNEIRERIQDTSKRIKRLGESSQEIGEIVELISDITEQTNVLALNAAIQAASAGEAGRGFTVVAEEVQRLAERSAEATRQIGAIVKGIQTDTSEAVSAMEKSTHGVVQGARLSDAAGQALNEIGEVSDKLARLIEQFTVVAQQQAQAAGAVADNMQQILGVTQQTTEGTQRTAASIEQLAALARELRESVSGFRIA